MDTYLFLCVIGVISSKGALANDFVNLDVHHLCDDISHIQCNTYNPGDTDEVVCDTNGNIYYNFCEFSKASCQDPSIQFDYLGHCVGDTYPTVPTARPTIITTSTPMSTTTTIQQEKTTTPPHTTHPHTTHPHTPHITSTVATTTIDPIFQVFCTNANLVDCTSQGFSPVCGSDGQIYLNECDLSKAKCQNLGLVIDPSRCQS